MDRSGTLNRMKKVGWFIPLLLLASCAGSSRRGGLPPGVSADRPPVSRSCKPLSEEDRARVLELADPENFPATRYRKGPNAERGIEKETDCSHFVHEIYRRAGLPFGFRPTSELGNAREFDILPEKEARPGDLMLFKGHVGIINQDGKIISALRTRHRRRKSSIEALDRKNFRSFRGQRYVLRYRCLPAAVNASRSLASEKKKR